MTPPQHMQPKAKQVSGKPISRSDLFKYTNGRFLCNEKYHCDGRFIEFDIDELCAIAASAGPGPPSPIHSIEKFEGGFCKALLLQKENGSELIAKLPFPIAGPPKQTTEAEVAVVKYGKACTNNATPYSRS